MIIRFHYCHRFKGFPVWSWLLEKAQGKPFSHLIMEVETGYTQEPDIYESIFPKSRQLPKKVWLRDTHLKIVETFEFKFSNDDFICPRIMDELNDCLDREYSYFQLMMIEVAKMVGCLASIIGRTTWNGRKFLHCTEYGARVQQIMGYKFKETPDTVDLVESYEACKALKARGL